MVRRIRAAAGRRRVEPISLAQVTIENQALTTSRPSTPRRTAASPRPERPVPAAVGPGRRRRDRDAPRGLAKRLPRQRRLHPLGAAEDAPRSTSAPTRRRSRPSTWWSTSSGATTWASTSATPAGHLDRSRRRPRACRKPIQRIVGDAGSVQMMDIATRIGLDPDAVQNVRPGRHATRERRRHLQLHRLGGGRVIARPGLGARAHRHRDGADPRPGHLQQGDVPAAARPRSPRSSPAGCPTRSTPSEYAGCYYPRFIAGSTTAVQPRLRAGARPQRPRQPARHGRPDRPRGRRRSSRSGASPGAATGATPTPCTSS